jgi:hypothetical protein
MFLIVLQRSKSYQTWRNAMREDVKRILELAREEATKVETWADLSNFIFAPDEGLLAGVFTTQAERTAFIKTPEFQELRRLIDEVRDKTGFLEGMTPKRPLAGMEPGWHEKLERRLAEIRAGFADGIPAEEVFAKFREKQA